MEAPEYFQNSFCKANNGAGAGGDNFMVEDLLDFSNDDAVITDGVAVAAASVAFDNVTGNSTDSSTLTVIDSSCNSSLSGCEPANFAADFGGRSLNEVPFSSDLCVPYDDLAELEWQLTSFSEESFSSEDLQKLQLISGMKARPDEAASETRHFQPDPNNNHSNSNHTNPIFNSDVSVPAKARSKRSRAAPGNWTSRLLLLSPTESSPESSDVVLSETPLPPPAASSVGKKALKTAPKKKNENSDGGSAPGDGRKCLHCATDKTPQWRTGPMGPKTLCNACGVRYKSGRLVPEYRPAASPTFVLTKHSNSHRKVMELRRQKEMVKAQQHYIHHPPPQHHHHHNPNMLFDVNGGDYLIHQHVGPDFRQLI
ncbi:GATA transcription factor 12 [Argentina anserina]|uniref:GATA transcription factor 12 n=1 Tax=Argentina anserina TaxID=57926 RepID=UPI0021762AC9|nr:GATA transcription factor 12 [Potentilla anserina]